MKTAVLITQNTGQEGVLPGARSNNTNKPGLTPI